MTSSAIPGKRMQQGKAATEQWMGRIYDLDLAQRLGWRVVESGTEVGDRLIGSTMMYSSTGYRNASETPALSG
jgi:hypothetical protein